MVLKKPLALAVYLLSGVFLVLGGLFIAAPEVAAALYGLPSHDRSALFYVRAIGFRDIALGAYLAGLALAGRRQALAIVMACTLIIPIGDLLLLAFADTGEPLHYLLHSASLLCFAGLALWSSRAARAP
jgi:hypothetical protein